VSMLDFMACDQLFIIILGASEIPSKISASYFILLKTPIGSRL
jgi:hypothetical protein